MPRFRLDACAVHIGSTAATAPAAPLPPRSFPYDAVERMTRIAGLAGVQTQSQTALFGADATVEAVRRTLATAADVLVPDGLFVLSFAGHGRQIPDEDDDEADGYDEAWVLADGLLVDDELSRALARFPATAQVVVVSDCCYSGGIDDDVPAPSPAVRARRITEPPVPPRRRRRRATTPVVVLAACGEDQTRVITPRSRLSKMIEEIVFPGGVRNDNCASYAQLEQELQARSPDAERPVVWSPEPAIRDLRPFDLGSRG